jgi:hypothetical protein
MKTIEELMTTKIIPEILEEISKCTIEEQIKTILLKNNSPALRMMFTYVFRPSDAKDDFFVKDLPVYKPDPGPIGVNPNSLFVEMRRLYIFLNSKVLPNKKKMELLIAILESVHPSEAELLGKIFKHDLGIPLLTEKLVRETLFQKEKI